MLLITRFNRLIHNKFILGAFAVLVSLLFVLSFSSLQGLSDSIPDAAGTLYGEKISAREVQSAIAFEQGIINDNNLTDQEYEARRENAWKRLAMLRTAAKLGLTTPDEEIGQALRNDPTFHVNGSFDRARYEGLIRQQLRIPVETFEENLRQNLTLRKLNAAVESMVWVSPYELSQRLENLTDDLHIAYTTLPQERFATNEITLAPEAVRAFYDANTNLFLEPERVSVRYLTFPYTNYALDEVSEDLIAAYYDRNLEQYMGTGTNGFSEAMPLDEVRDEITPAVRTQQARLAARDAATRVVIDLAPDRYGKQIPFEVVAASNALNVTTSALFAIAEPVAGLEVDWQFRKAAFDLIKDDPESYFSDALDGSNAVYIVATSTRTPAHIPAFEEIVDRVEPLALLEAQQEAFTAAAKVYRDELASQLTGITNKQVLVTSVSDQQLNFVMPPPFSVLDAMNTNLFAESLPIVPTVVELETGELSDFVQTEEGGMLVYMLQRTPGDISTLFGIRPQLLASLQEFRSRLQMEAWADRILQDADFTDLMTTDQDADQDDL